jgi:hypothetical protein
VARLVGGLAAAFITGAAIYGLVTALLLPELSARLSAGHIGWLRHAFAAHPAAVLFALLAISAVLALPVLLVFRWVYGPLRPAGDRQVANRGHSDSEESHERMSRHR